MTKNKLLYLTILLILVFKDVAFCQSSLAQKLDTTEINRIINSVDLEDIDNYDSLNQSLETAYLNATKIKFQPGRIAALKKLGDYNFRKGFLYRASDQYLRALAIAEAIHSVKEEISLTKKIGDTYFEDNLEQAVYYFKKNAELHKKQNNIERFLLAINDLGIAYLTHNKLDSAEIYFNKCLKDNEKYDFIKIKSAASANLGIVYELKGQYQKAFDQLTKALEFAKIDGYGDTYPFVKGKLAKVYLKLGYKERGLILAKEALNELPDKYITHKTNLYEILAKAFEENGEYEKALKNYTIYATDKLKEDSLKRKQISGLLNLTFENEKQQQNLNKISLSIQEQEFRNTLLMLVLGSLVIITCIIYYSYSSQRKKAGLIEKQKQRIQKLNEGLETRVLERTTELLEANKQLVNKNTEIAKAHYDGQSQERERLASELHDNIGGTLTALKWQFQTIEKQTLSVDNRKVYDSILSTIEDAYANVRLLSHNMLPTELTSNGLVGALEKLVSDLNSSKLMNFIILAEPNFQLTDKRIALELYSCCLEAITNTLKHSKATECIIKLAQTTTKTTLSISDNGVGLGQIEPNKKGKGLKSITERVTRLNGEFSHTNAPGAILKIEVPFMLF